MDRTYHEPRFDRLHRAAVRQSLQQGRPTPKDDPDDRLYRDDPDDRLYRDEPALFDWLGIVAGYALVIIGIRWLTGAGYGTAALLLALVSMGGLFGLWARERYDFLLTERRAGIR